MTIKRRIEKLEHSRVITESIYVSYRKDETPEEACTRQGIEYSEDLVFIGPVWIELEGAQR